MDSEGELSMATIKINTTAGSNFWYQYKAVLANSTDLAPGFGFFINDNMVVSPLSMVGTGTDGQKGTFRGTINTDFPSLSSITSVVLTQDGNPYAQLAGFEQPLFVLASNAWDSNFDFYDIQKGFDAFKFEGNDGADSFTGSAYADTLSGGKGDDWLSGYYGNDLIEGGEGADFVDGGIGNDTATYANSAARVSISLLSGKASGGDATGDRFRGIENLVGSDFNDKLTGTNTNNILTGGKGNDLLIGLRGRDTFNGGEGRDTVSLAASKFAVEVNLESGLGSGGDAQGDTYNQIEDVIGSKNDDTLIGSSNENRLSGGAGNDTLDGGSNNDILKGGSGNDRLIGGQGIDTIFGDAGKDTIVLDRLPGNYDVINKFVSGADTLEINATDFGGNLVAGQALGADQLLLNTTGLAENANNRFILNTETQELFFDVNGSKDGDVGSRLIAVFKGDLALVVTDFDIV